MGRGGVRHFQERDRVHKRLSRRIWQMQTLPSGACSEMIPCLNRSDLIIGHAARCITSVSPRQHIVGHGSKRVYNSSSREL